MDSAYYAGKVIAAIRRAGALFARGATVRRDLINVAARTARSGRRHIALHLPDGWYLEHEWMNLLAAACGPATRPRPDQPGPARRIATAPSGNPNPTPSQEPQTSRRTGKRRKTHALFTAKIKSTGR